MGYVNLTGVSKTFALRQGWWRKSLLRAVDRVDFEIPQGKTFGLVGESGSGKTTIARMIVGLLPLDGGEITVGGKAYQLRPKKARSEYLKQLSIVFQNPYASLDPRQDVYHIVSEPLRAFRLHSEKDMMDRVCDLLQTVGLSPEHVHRYAHEFSGGQRQRIAIARALSLNPSLLILDEPTSALDVSVQAKIINLLTTLQAKNGLTYLFISHNMGVVRHVSNFIGVMYRGRLLERGEAETIITNPAHPYTQYLIAAIPRIEHREAEPPAPVVEMVGSTQDGCPFVAKCPRRLPRCASVFPERAVLQENHIVYCHLYS
jgi:peptide/nickel transport system ATP-binding protein